MLNLHCNLSNRFVQYQDLYRSIYKIKIKLNKNIRLSRIGFQSAAIHEQTTLLSYGSEPYTGHRHLPS